MLILYFLNCLITCMAVYCLSVRISGHMHQHQLFWLYYVFIKVEVKRFNILSPCVIEKMNLTYAHYKLKMVLC